MSDAYSGAGLKLGLIGTGVLATAFFIIRMVGNGCAKPETQADFSVPDYTGVWYEFEKVPNAF